MYGQPDIFMKLNKQNCNINISTSNLGSVESSPIVFSCDGSLRIIQSISEDDLRAHIPNSDSFVGVIGYNDQHELNMFNALWGNNILFTLSSASIVSRNFIEITTEDSVLQISRPYYFHHVIFINCSPE